MNDNDNDNNKKFPVWTEKHTEIVRNYEKLKKEGKLKTMVLIPRTESPHPEIYYARSPMRTSEPDFIKADKAINKHQEKITHNETCRCKQYDFDDMVVMYEHIEQYPQFRCYCKWCISKLQMDCSPFHEVQEEVNHVFKSQLQTVLFVKKGIHLQ